MVLTEIVSAHFRTMLVTDTHAQLACLTHKDCSRFLVSMLATLLKLGRSSIIPLPVFGIPNRPPPLERAGLPPPVADALPGRTADKGADTTGADGGALAGAETGAGDGGGTCA